MNAGNVAWENQARQNAARWDKALAPVRAAALARPAATGARLNLRQVARMARTVGISLPAMLLMLVKH